MYYTRDNAVCVLYVGDGNLAYPKSIVTGSVGAICACGEVNYR